MCHGCARHQVDKRGVMASFQSVRSDLEASRLAEGTTASSSAPPVGDQERIRAALATEAADKIDQNYIDMMERPSTDGAPVVPAEAGHDCAVCGDFCRCGDGLPRGERFLVPVPEHAHVCAGCGVTFCMKHWVAHDCHQFWQHAAAARAVAAILIQRWTRQRAQRAVAAAIMVPTEVGEV